ncbi:MAG: hypothetical protein COT85_07040 [Chlamydiae bacterium CG10_big_fil_rev_8_21_14_0_10_42_34]|nr:MAG: hypothetical protein COT85_07040 [Chlamydiae bacterium CG10_big_fil_rev_8_21_14_0_10_42_34]
MSLPTKTKTLKTVWPVKQTVNLGNLITFRQEIELICTAYGYSNALIFFEQTPPQIQTQLSYFNDVLKSETIAIKVIFDCLGKEDVEWPPNDPEIEKWSYGSFKRVGLLHQKTNLFPNLSWPLDNLNKAKDLYENLRTNCEKVIAVHLKNQGKGQPEESNAQFSSWAEFFSENLHIKFLLLGDDHFPSHLLTPNLVLARQMDVNLITQLAFCSLCDGFLGMAAGIATAACLSTTPYVIFKHPSHHVAEMEIELGDLDHLSFALGNQKLWRITDDLKNIRAGYEVLKS